jgi:hypothetical protein
MQREIMNGVPYFIDGKGNLYTWDPKNPVRIGTYTTDTEQPGKQSSSKQSSKQPSTKQPIIEPKCRSELYSLVEQWRILQEPRKRKADS